MTKKFLQRSLFTCSAFAMAVCFALTGCTDAFVGPEDALETNRTVVEASGEVAMQPPVHELNGKLHMRNYMPFLPPESNTDPDESVSLESDSTQTNGRLTMRNAVVFSNPATAGSGEESPSGEENSGESPGNNEQNSSDDQGGS